MPGDDRDALLVYIGTYTSSGPAPRGRAEGIYSARFDQRTGALTLVDVVHDVPNPSFLALHPNGRSLYAVNETTEIDGHPGGGVSSFAVDPLHGALTYLGRQPSHGADPCHITVDSTGRLVLVANYSSGTVAAFPVREGGALDPASDVQQHSRSSRDPERQAGPHAHQILPDPTNRLALAADLGLDQVRVYQLDTATGRLVPHDPPAATLPPGSGPRHLAFHPHAPYVYIINELASTISTCRWDAAAGTIELLRTIPTLPDGFSGSNSCADIHVAPSGRFVYGSNRGHDSIAGCAIDPAAGALTPIGYWPSGGREPRNFAIDPSGAWLLAANQESDSIVTFRLDSESGALTPTGAVMTVPSPACILFAPTR